MPLRPLSAPPPRTLVLLPLRRCFFPLNITLDIDEDEASTKELGSFFCPLGKQLMRILVLKTYPSPGLQVRRLGNGSERSSLERKRTDKRVASFGAVSDDERHATAKNR